MKKIIAIGGSSSQNSINKTWANYVAQQVTNAEVNLIDLNDFEMPLYSIDREKENAHHPLAEKFYDILKNSDGIVISLAEHNGSYATAMKNVIDWTSRVEKDFWSQKPMLLMSTSPGGRGGATVLGAAQTYFPRLGANIIENFSLPNFGENFSKNGIQNEELNNEFQEKLAKFTAAL